MTTDTKEKTAKGRADINEEKLGLDNIERHERVITVNFNLVTNILNNRAKLDPFVRNTTGDRVISAEYDALTKQIDTFLRDTSTRQKQIEIIQQKESIAHQKEIQKNQEKQHRVNLWFVVIGAIIGAIGTNIYDFYSWASTFSLPFS